MGFHIIYEQGLYVGKKEILEKVKHECYWTYERLKDG